MILKDYLLKNKLSLEAFGKKIGMGKTMISLFINNKRQPTITTQIAIHFVTAGEVTRKDWTIKSDK